MINEDFIATLPYCKFYKGVPLATVLFMTS
jgi:hypothetical protein